jgi:cytochrome P450
MFLLLAGHLAVRNLIGNAIYLLLTHQEQWAALRADPALLHDAIEETLRYEPPVTLIPRVASEDLQWQGQLIRRGEVVQLSIASAIAIRRTSPTASVSTFRERPAST